MGSSGRALWPLEVDDQLERRRLLKGEVTGIGALEDLVNVSGHPASPIILVWRVSHEAAGHRKPAMGIDGWESRLRSQLDDERPASQEFRLVAHHHSLRAFLHHRGEGAPIFWLLERVADSRTVDPNTGTLGRLAREASPHPLPRCP